MIRYNRYKSNSIYVSIENRQLTLEVVGYVLPETATFYHGYLSETTSENLEVCSVLRFASRDSRFFLCRLFPFRLVEPFTAKAKHAV